MTKQHSMKGADVFEDGQMHEAVAAIAATGVSPLVRIAANEAWMVKSAHFLIPTPNNSS